MLKLLLRRNKYDVTVAGDGVAGLNALSAEAIDLVIADINMPELDGLGMVAAMREDDRYAELPVLMLTATSDDGHQDRAAHLGVKGFITQPFDSQQLIATVQSLVPA